MANIYAIKARIKGVESTEKTTSTMKLVATSKLHQTRAQLANQASFSQRCRKSLSMVLAGAGEAKNPLLQKREVKRACYVLFVGNRGLCGAYNAEVLRYMYGLIKEETAECCQVVVGRWNGEHRRDKSLNIVKYFDDFDDVPGASQCSMLAEYLLQLYLKGEADKVVLVYQQREGLGQVCRSRQLIPFQQEQEEQSGSDWIFEPDMDTLINTLVNMCVESTVGEVMLEAKLSEHFARMTAMTSATDNARELLEELNLTLNRTRQAKITTEISEIVGGANALSIEDN